MQQVESRGRDQLAKEVEARIIPFNDLPAADAEYHEHCRMNFMRKVTQTVRPTRGAPENPEITAAMNKIFEHLESHDECQYGIDELIDIGGK